MLNTWYVWIVALLLVVISAGFVQRFVRPALRLRQEFGGVIELLKGIRPVAAGGADLRQHIAAKVMAGTSIAHVWSEYAQTLHQQRQAGQGDTRWRATALAETFFTDQALIDTPLKTEYYKHLPGIMTGLGIIGTFTGLINGLANFDVSIDPGQAQVQLRTLINAVGHAFIVSAIAIALAMIFTWIEKSLVTACYRLAEHIRQEIDSLFDTGADVEYLERLVAAAESSAREVAQLKDTLAGQIVKALTEQTREQIAASDRNSERISSDLGRLLGASLSQPIADIAAAVTTLGARQDETVTRMITEVVNGFSARMENLFAGQMQELHEVLSHTNRSMREMVGQFSQMASSLQEQSKAAAGSQQVQVERLTQTVSASVDGMSGQVEKLVVISIATNHTLQETVAALARATDDAIRGMNEGADKLGAAASNFATAGQHVSTTIEDSSKAAEKIRLAANSMQKSAEAAHQILGDYSHAHAAFAHLVDDLKLTIDRARREASLSAELTDRLEAAATKLSRAQQQADVYLDGVSKVLGHAHQAFAESVERTLREANRQFQGELSQAVGLLSGAIVDLGETVEALAEHGRP